MVLKCKYVIQFMLAKNIDFEERNRETYIHIIIKNNNNMYSLKCSYYEKEFDSINELVDDVMASGMDPNYEITKDGKGIGEEVIDYIVF
jgi:hypothetical protein